MKLRDTFGKFRQAQIWDKRFKMPTVIIKVVVVIYALVGLGATGLVLKNESTKLYDEVTQAKTITIVTDVEETGDGEISDPVGDEQDEITDCYSAAERWGKEYQVNPELLKKIVRSESGNRETVENKVSTATGCSQFILGTWRSRGKALWGDEFYNKNIYNPSDNVELMAWTISKYGTADWDASRSVWGK